MELARAGREASPPQTKPPCSWEEAAAACYPSEEARSLCRWLGQQPPRPRALWLPSALLKWELLKCSALELRSAGPRMLQAAFPGGPMGGNGDVLPILLPFSTFVTFLCLFFFNQKEK